ncbi:MAG: hypothetical protein HY782_21670 [Chloroflexi bacterium]|nr:hypothetical protein [Chloroflexota bacterium]
MTFDELLAALETATFVTAKQRIIRDFANTHESPIVEDTRVIFFYISPDAREVYLEGDWTNWQPAAMAYLPDTSLWYRVEQFPRAARLEYRIVVNGHRRLDPRNPRIAQSGYGPHSELAMPGYQEPREITDGSRIDRGLVEPHWMTSRELGDRRTFWVCLPPHFDPLKRCRVAYFNDGGDYMRLADLPRLADYLIARGDVPPFIAVLVKPNDREKEYARNNAHARFIVNELVPWIDANYPTRAERDGRALIGASFGGLQAAHIARRRPNVFGLVGGQSGYYSYQNDALIKDYAAAPNLGIRFHLVVGQYETNLNATGRPEMNLVAAQERFARVLRDKGYAVISEEYPEGHQWGFWRAHLGDALRFFWGPYLK